MASSDWYQGRIRAFEEGSSHLYYRILTWTAFNMIVISYAINIVAAIFWFYQYVIWQVVPVIAYSHATFAIVMTFIVVPIIAFITWVVAMIIKESGSRFWENREKKLKTQT